VRAARSVSARQKHGVHRSWRYRLLDRYRAEGAAGLARRSRRAHTQPHAVPRRSSSKVVRLRAALLAEGLDAGALTIQWHLLQRAGSAPAVS
jgi:hypothetical protein